MFDDNPGSRQHEEVYPLYFYRILAVHSIKGFKHNRIVVLLNINMLG